jgi:hypothetical protein
VPVKGENFWLPATAFTDAGTDSLPIGESVAFRVWVAVADEPKLPLPATRHHPSAIGQGRQNGRNILVANIENRAWHGAKTVVKVSNGY